MKVLTRALLAVVVVVLGLYLLALLSGDEGDSGPSLLLVVNVVGVVGAVLIGRGLLTALRVQRSIPDVAVPVDEVRGDQALVEGRVVTSETVDIRSLGRKTFRTKSGFDGAMRSLLDSLPPMVHVRAADTNRWSTTRYDGVDTAFEPSGVNEETLVVTHKYREEGKSKAVVFERSVPFGVSDGSGVAQVQPKRASVHAEVLVDEGDRSVRGIRADSQVAVGGPCRRGDGGLEFVKRRGVAPQVLVGDAATLSAMVDGAARRRKRWAGAWVALWVVAVVVVGLA